MLFFWIKMQFVLIYLYFLSKNSHFKYIPFSILNILICHRLIHEPLGGAVTYTDESEWLHENLCFESWKTSHHLSVTSFTLNGCIRLDMFVNLTFCSLQLDARHNRRNPASTAATHRHTSAKRDLYFSRCQILHVPHHETYLIRSLMRSWSSHCFNIELFTLWLWIQSGFD